MQPSNVLIEEHGRAVVSDFSLAKPLGSNATNTHSGTPTNQLRYQAPEINEGQPMTAAADVYSWAMTSLQVVSGSTSIASFFFVPTDESWLRCTIPYLSDRWSDDEGHPGR